MAVYNPQSKYTWTKEDKFEMTGEQFGMILNSMRAIYSTGLVDAMMMIAEANGAIEAVMAEAVKNDIVKEVPEVAKSGISDIKQKLRKT
jgi:hypothetical protein